MSTIEEGTLLWEPSPALQDNSAMRAYIDWLAAERGLTFADYSALWQWSVDQLEDFWGSLWDFYAIQASQPYTAVLPDRSMPGAQWFPGARLNLAEHAFRHASADAPALLFRSERQPTIAISWKELRQQVGSVATALRGLGVAEGDRVVGYVPNIPEAVVAFLACASIGAIWSSCSPDFGSASVIDRFTQIDPKILLAVDGYVYGGKGHDRSDVLGALQRALPSLEKTILIPYLDTSRQPADDSTLLWADLLATPGELTFAQVPFDQPLWVLYSSGTTGLPKPIVQGHGGILLELLKSLNIQLDIKAGDRFFWFSTTGWMMWNFLVGGLLVGATILLYDGSPGYPDINALWEYAAETGMTYFGTSAAYITACMKAEIEPGQQYDLSALRGIGSTGSPLPPEGFLWVYQHIKPDLMLSSISGGTDVCTGVVGGAPLLPVYSGEIQCRHLGAPVAAFDEAGNAVINEVGEFVMTAPMPSMPLFFWNDPDQVRYQASYFEMYPGIWRHGDWVKVTDRGTLVIYGRSDSTINRMGIRMGTSDIYRAVEVLPEVLDSLVIDVETTPGAASYMPLFVVLHPDATLDEALITRIKGSIRETLSRRHVPDEIITVAEVPRTLSGKKLEIPIKKLYRGVALEKAANRDSMRNPEVLDEFAALARAYQQRTAG